MIKLRMIVVVHDLKRQGLSISAITRRTGLDRKTVRKYLERGLEAPRYSPRTPRVLLIPMHLNAIPESFEHDSDDT